MKTNWTSGPAQLTACRIADDGADGAKAKPFALPRDGWIMLLPLGTYPGTLRTYTDGEENREPIEQVFDEKAIKAICDSWNARKTAMGSNFPGMLVDYDHFSHNEDMPTGAAGWIESVEARGDGLWGLPRWSEDGKAKLEGGMYRLVSPVLSGFESLGEEGGKKKLRPTVLERLALTNDPQLRGMPPVSNRAGTANNKSTMDHKKLLLQLLGLPDTATDSEISDACSAAMSAMNGCAVDGKKGIAEMRNRIVSLSGELTVVRNERDAAKADAQTANKALVDADLIRFKCLAPDEKLREMLTANRSVAVAALEVALASKGTGDSSGNGNGSGYTPRHDAKNRSHPGSADGDNATEMNDRDAAQIRLRADELAKEKGWGFNRAFDEALIEYRMRRRAASAK